MSNPQRPLTPAERAARVASRTFPGSGGGFVSGVSPVRSRNMGMKVQSGGGGGGTTVYVQDDEPSVSTVGTLWFDTDETCEQQGGVTSVNGLTGDVILTAGDVGAIPSDMLGAANGVATLGSDSKVPLAQLPTAAGGITVQDENGTLSTSITQIDFQGTGVTASPGSGGEVIVTIPTGGHTIADEGASLPQRTLMDFTGLGVAASDSAGRTVVNVPGLTVEDENVTVKSGATILDFQGSGVTVTDGGGGQAIVTVNSGTGGHTVQDEGSSVSGRTNLNFVGPGVTVTDDSGNDRTIVTIPGSAFTIQDEGSTVATNVIQLDFIGAGVTAVSGTGEVTVTIPPNNGHTVLDEGTPLTQRPNINFVGAGVTVTDDSTNDWTTVTIPGGGGSSGHTIADESTPLTARTNLDFVGAGVTVTDDSGGDRTVVTIPGGGGGSNTYITSAGTKVQEFTATAGQTAFTLMNTPTLGTVRVHQNGLRLRNSDWSIAGTTVTLVSGALLNDTIGIEYDGPTGVGSIIVQPTPDDIPASPNAHDYEFNADTTSLPSSWTMPNTQSGTATYQEKFGKGRITIPGVTAVTIVGLERPLTTDATWEYTCKLQLITSIQNYREITMYLRDSVGGRVLSFSMDHRASSWKKWTNLTTWNSEAFGTLPNGWPSPAPMYLRIKKISSTVMEGWASWDGFDFIKYINFTASETGWLTTAPDKIGWGASCSTSAGTNHVVSCDWFRRTA